MQLVIAEVQGGNPALHGDDLDAVRAPAVPEPDLLVIVATDDDVVPAHHVIAVGKYIDSPGTKGQGYQESRKGAAVTEKEIIRRLSPNEYESRGYHNIAR